MPIDLEDKENDGRLKILRASIAGSVLAYFFYKQYFFTTYSIGGGPFSGSPPDPFCESLFSGGSFCGPGSYSFSTHSTILLFYYIFNCLLLFSISFALFGNKPKIAKFIAIILNISVFGSLFWARIGFDSVFVFTTILGSLFGLMIPPFGIIPVIIFFLGIKASLSLIFKKPKVETALK